MKTVAEQKIKNKGAISFAADITGSFEPTLRKILNGTVYAEDAMTIRQAQKFKEFFDIDLDDWDTAIAEYPIVEQLRIDLKVFNDTQIKDLYDVIREYSARIGMKVLDDGNAPYTEDLTEVYIENGFKF